MSEPPKVEFALGSEVSPGHFYKSSFARSFIGGPRDSKSLDYEFLDNGTIVEEPSPAAAAADTNNDNINNAKSNNYFSLLNFVNNVGYSTDVANNEDEKINNNNSTWKLQKVC